MPDAKERKPFTAFGIDFSQIPHMDSATADRIIQGAAEDCRREYDPQHPEEPRISPETLGMRFEPRKR